MIIVPLSVKASNNLLIENIFSILLHLTIYIYFFISHPPFFFQFLYIPYKLDFQNCAISLNNEKLSFTKKEMKMPFQIQRNFKAITENKNFISDMKIRAEFELLPSCAGHISAFLSTLNRPVENICNLFTYYLKIRVDDTAP